MARPNPTRSIQGESNLAQRIALERRRQEWSYETLARRMTEAGCPINASAIYKIEKGNPPRKITVDELIAFADVFDQEVEDLLTPIDLYRKEHAKMVARKIDEARDQLSNALAALANGYIEYFDLAVYDPELREFVDNRQLQEDMVDAASSGRLFTLTLAGVRADDELDDGPLREAVRALHSEMVALAAEGAKRAIDVLEGRQSGE
ncbi:helix-turn-helix domain-containing protein [Ornithinimicrobium sp. Y1847]|uniref:helix-turn-helix domain-containing protein n=1 Tax=unclassified Ornithinimicrobium TaxID=2615080 RepID=UPI003B6840F2